MWGNKAFANAGIVWTWANTLMLVVVNTIYEYSHGSLLEIESSLNACSSLFLWKANFKQIWWAQILLSPNCGFNGDNIKRHDSRYT